MTDRSATPVLASARLRLRPRRIEDADALYAAMRDSAVMHFWSRPPYATPEEARADFAREAPEWRNWAITLAGDDRAIGFVAAGEKRQGKVVELGYLLAPEHQGRGVAREALTLVIDRLFAEGNRRVFADTDPDNAASRALLEALGFTLEGVLRAEWETHIGVRDTALYGLLRAEWQASRPPVPPSG